MKKAFRLLRYILNHPLNKSGRSAAVSRVLRWQIGSRLLPFGSALPFANGTHLFTTRGMTGATGNWYCGLHEVEEMAFVLHALRPGDLFVDVGANIGSYTVLAAGAVGADAIAIEPVPTTFDALRRNVYLNDIAHRVDCVNAGLGETEGELRFTANQDTTNHVMAQGESGNAVVVCVKRLDDICAERIPSVIKIDVEGYEQAVIAGGEKTLTDERLKAVIMETNGSGLRYGWDDARLVETMRNYGFSTCTYEPFGRRLEAAPAGTGNTIFVRDMALMQDCLTEAPRFQLVNGEL